MNGTYKGVVYAYPESPSARDFGKANTGCWVVVVFGEYGDGGGECDKRSWDDVVRAFSDPA